MILPLGLGFKFFKIPYITMLLCVACVVIYFKDPRRTEKINDQIIKTFSAEKMGALEGGLFQDYCLQQEGTAQPCSEIGKYLETNYQSRPVKRPTKGKSKVPKEQQFSFEGSVEEETRYLSMINRFQKLVQKPDEKFESLAHFDAYSDGLDRVRLKLTDYYKSENLLSSKSMEPLALLLAQFSHASVSHMFGNLVFLFVFGAYVEARVGAIGFLLAYLIGGSVGLLAQVALFSTPEQYLVGASANVSAIMGMFFVLFFRFRMKFLVWYFVGRTFYAPVSYTFPFMFILSELIGGLQGLTYGGTEVAHFAHLGGILFGAYAAFMAESLQIIPWPFLYSDETEKYKKMKAEETLIKKLAAGRDILKYNPQNYVTRRYLLTQCLAHCRTQALIDAQIVVFLRENCLTYLDDCARNKNEDATFNFLEMFPHHLPFHKIFEGMRTGTAVQLGDQALNRGALFLAMKLYDFFLMRFASSRKVKSLKMTLEEVVKHLPQDAETDRNIELYRRAHPDSSAVIFWDARNAAAKMDAQNEKTVVVAA